MEAKNIELLNRDKKYVAELSATQSSHADKLDEITKKHVKQLEQLAKENEKKER